MTAAEMPFQLTYERKLKKIVPRAALHGNEKKNIDKASNCAIFRMEIGFIMRKSNLFLYHKLVLNTMSHGPS